MPTQEGPIKPAGGPSLLTNCPNCGASISADSKFCSNCGSKTSQFAVVTDPSGPVSDSTSTVAETPSGGVEAESSGAGLSATATRLARIISDRYTIVRELGRGGMATVFLARDEKHGRQVAIKVLHPELSASIGGERFEREIRLVANLQHPNILGLYDSGSADGLLYYVMPFVEGESLRDRIDREGQLPVDDAIRITLEVASALGYAHNRGIIHRDIKPENILLTEEHTLVADFGIAKAASEASSQKLTQTGMAVGTPLYMAPEQAGGEAVGPTADIYSLGCMLYEMLAGEPPFTGKNPVAIMARHAMEQVPSIRIVRSIVAEEVEEAIFRAMGKVPADRPQTAAQFAEILGMPLGSTAVMRTRGMTATRRTVSGAQAMFAPMPWWRRRPVMLGAAAIVIAAAFGAWRFSTADSGVNVFGADARRIAVLYFQDQSRDTSLGPLADGLTEGLIRALSTAPSLTVISRTGVEPYRDVRVPADSIARALRVGFLVRGDVEPEGNQIRVNVRLDDHSGVNLRRASLLQPAANITAVQDTLSILVADLIKQQLREEIAVRDLRAGTASADAWLLLQRAEQTRKRAEQFGRAGDAAARDLNFDAADSLADAAERTDRRWIEPRILRATIAYNRSRAAAGDLGVIGRWTDVGVGHASRALELDPRNADALEIRGTLRYWRWLTRVERTRPLLEAAQADLEQAVTTNPRQAGAYASLSHLYYQTGTPADVNIAAQRAWEADEFLANADVVLGRLFLSAYDLGHFERADEWCGEARRRFPQNVLAVRCQLYLLTTRLREPNVTLAWRLADSIEAAAPAPMRAAQRATADLLVAAVLARASRNQPALADSARRVLQRSEGDASTDATGDLAYFAAFVYNLLGDRDNTFRLLRRSVAANPHLAETLRTDPGWLFRDIAGDRRFRQLTGVSE